MIQDTTKAARCALLAVLALCGLMASWAAAEAVTLAFLPTENRSTRILDSGALMGQIELISTTTLTSGEFSDQFVVLERAAIDDILRERTIEGDVVRSMLSSTLLVSSSVIDLPAPRVLLQQEVIAADNGRLIHSLHVASRHDDIEGVAQTLGERFPTFLRELLQRYELSQRLPLVEVTTDLQSDWLVLTEQKDDIHAALSSALSGRRDCVQIIARHPLSHAEERLLKAIGLAEPTDTQGYRPLPDIRMHADLKAGLTPEQELRSTPLTLQLSFYRNRTLAGNATFACTLPSWQACRDQAVAWVQAEFPVRLSSREPVPLDEREKDAKWQAEQELAFIHDVLGGKYWGIRDIQSDQVRQAVLAHAMRAYRLDPTHPIAACVAAYLIESGTAAEPKQPIGQLHRYDRIIRTCRRCLDRFPREPRNATLYDYVLFRLSECALRAPGLVHVVAGQYREDSWISDWAREKEYRYGRLYVRALAEMGFNDEYTSCAMSWSGAIGFGYAVVRMILSVCPEQYLDEEYKYWRDFYDAKMSLLVKDGKLADTSAAPWPLIEAAFAARRRDVVAVKLCLQEMADEHPESRKWLWQDGRRVRDLLTAAGAEDAGTWQPEFKKETRRAFTNREWYEFLRSLRPPFPLHYGQAHVLPLKGLKIESPPGSERGRFQVEYVSGAEVFATLTQLPERLRRGEPGTVPLLYVAKVMSSSPAEGVAQLVGLTPVLPEVLCHVGGTTYARLSITCATGQRGAQGSVVWLGTADRGLVLCTQDKGGQWSARLLDLASIPTLHILSVVPCRSEGMPAALVAGYLDDGEKHVLFVIDTAGEQCRVLASAKGAGSARHFCWLAELDDGQLIPFPVLDCQPYHPMAVERMRGATGRGFDLYHAVSSFDPAAGKETIWGLEYVNTPLRYMALGEMAPGTDRLAEDRAFPPPQAVRVLLAGDYNAGNCPDLDITGVFSYGPALSIAQIISGEPTLWMVGGMFNPGTTSNAGACLIGFRPAPAGAPTFAAEWIGPFAFSAPALNPILRRLDGNRFLVRDADSCYLADSDELYRAAKDAGQVKTPTQIRADVEAQLAREGWQAQIPAYTASRQFEKAEHVIAAALDPVAGVPEAQRQRVKLWQARLFAAQEKLQGKQYDRSIRAYAAIAVDPENDDFVRAFAFVHELRLLAEAERHAEFIEHYESPPTGMPHVTYRAYTLPGMLSHEFVARIRVKAGKLTSSNSQ